MNFLRKIVSGKKNRFKENGYDLDLTYVCPRLVAMSFPASGFEQLYRNPIEQVKKFIDERHGTNFLVFNLSNRKYDTSKFDHKVLDYQWEDHHSPPMHTLFLICEKIDNFLKSNIENVVIVHCLAGKGRTGTIICCYMLFCGLFRTPEEALAYYSRKRFKADHLGVNQPCQIRYIYYFNEILKKKNIYPTLCFINNITLKGKPKLKSCRPFFEIINVRTQEMIYTSMTGNSEQPLMEQDVLRTNIGKIVPLVGDVLVRIRDNGSIKDRTLARFSFNTAFINDLRHDEKRLLLQFSVEQLSPYGEQKDSYFPPDFNVSVNLQIVCLCSSQTPFDQKCFTCQSDMRIERPFWDTIYKVLNTYTNPVREETIIKLFRTEDQRDDHLIMDDLENCKQIIQASKIRQNLGIRSQASNDFLKESASSSQKKLIINRSGSDAQRFISQPLLQINDQGTHLLQEQQEQQALVPPQDSQDPDFYVTFIRKRSNVCANIYSENIDKSYNLPQSGENTSTRLVRAKTATAKIKSTENITTPRTNGQQQQKSPGDSEQVLPERDALLPEGQQVLEENEEEEEEEEEIEVEEEDEDAVRYRDASMDLRYQARSIEELRNRLGCKMIDSQGLMQFDTVSSEVAVQALQKPSSQPNFAHLDQDFSENIGEEILQTQPAHAEDHLSSAGKDANYLPQEGNGSQKLSQSDFIHDSKQGSLLNGMSVIERAGSSRIIHLRDSQPQNSSQITTNSPIPSEIHQITAQDEIYYTNPQHIDQYQTQVRVMGKRAEIGSSQSPRGLRCEPLTVTQEELSKSTQRELLGAVQKEQKNKAPPQTQTKSPDTDMSRKSDAIKHNTHSGVVLRNHQRYFDSDSNETYQDRKDSQQNSPDIQKKPASFLENNIPIALAPVNKNYDV